MLSLLLSLLVPSNVYAHGNSSHTSSHIGMSGPRGIIELDWTAANIARTFTAGYPDSFGVYSFFRREQPSYYRYKGVDCIKANFVAFDIDDTFQYNIDETVTVNLLFDPRETDTVLYGFDANGQTEAGGSISQPANGQPEFYRATIHLERARLANRGMDGADLTLTAKGTAQLEATDQRSTFGLCGLTIKAPDHQHALPSDKPASADLSIEWLDQGKPSPVRFGLYDSKGRSALPSEDALSLHFYNKTTQQLQLKNYQPRSQPWPHSNRHVLYSNGQYSSKLPAGRYTLITTKGPEYRVVKQVIDIIAGQKNTLSIPLQRWDNLPAKGWYSGDVHIHINRQSPEHNANIMSFLQAEDVHISNLLLMSNASDAHYQQYAYGKAGEYHQGRHSLIPGIEAPRTAQRGHAIALNIEQPIFDKDSYFLYHKFMQAYHGQNALNGYAHVGSEEFNASWGLALDVPFGLVDFVEIMQDSNLRTKIWYDFLSLGYRISPAAGSDFPYFDQPGSVRSYAKVAANKPSAQQWFNALKSGNTFVSNGPALTFSINQQAMGSTVKSSKQQRLHVKASARINPDLDKIETLELLSCGKVIKQVRANKQGILNLELDLAANTGQWLAVRASGEKYAMAHSAPIYIEDDTGFSGCKNRAKTLIKKMKKRLDALATTPITVNRELEYWETASLKKQYNSQLSALKKRIDQAHKHYDDLYDSLF